MAGSDKCSTKPLSKLISCILSAIKTGLKRYCGTSYSWNGVNQMWILKNSKDLLEYIQSMSLSSCNSIKHYLVLSSFMTYPRVCNQINRTRVPLVEQERLTLQKHPSSPRFQWGFELLDLQFYVYVLQIVVCPFVLVCLVIVFSALRFTDSDYHFGILKFFLNLLLLSPIDKIQ